MNEPDIRKTNDEIARKFGGIEADLAVCRGIRELFERLLSGSEEAFGVPFVWLSLLHGPETEELRSGNPTSCKTGSISSPRRCFSKFSRMLRTRFWQAGISDPSSA
jgi:hypothetical protein